MYNYVQRVFVGKPSGAASSAQVVGQPIDLSLVQVGDLFVTDENGLVLDAATAATVQTALVVRGTAPGKVVSSMPIHKLRGADHYTFQAYQAPVAQVTNFADLQLQPNTQYKLQVLIPQDLALVPNRQNRMEAYVTTGAVVTVADRDRLIANFNKQRVGLSVIKASALGTTGITLTSQPVPTVAINDYEFVRFEANFVSIAYINALSGQLNPVVYPVLLNPSSETKAVGGSGLAVQVRQIERVALSNYAITDLTQQHIRAVTLSAVDGVGYDVYNVQQHITGMGSMQDTKTYPQSTYVAVATGSAQKTAFGAVLDSFLSGVAVTPPTGE